MDSGFPCTPSEVANSKEAIGSAGFEGMGLLGRLWVKSQAARKHEAAAECTCE